MVVTSDSYVLTLRPGTDAESAAMRAARYIVDRWMPGNAGGVHLLVTPKMAKTLATLWASVNEHGTAMAIRVTIQGNRPHLDIIGPVD